MNTNFNAKEALIWIVSILKKNNISFQIAGGLAANIYGSTRALADIDIDIPEADFPIIEPIVKQYISFGPCRYHDESWDVLLMTLNYNDQLIDLSGAYQTKIFNIKTRVWQSLSVDFSRSESRSIFGVEIPIIPLSELINYKKILGREVDLMDVQQIEIYSDR